jgi:hypothetical protein
MTDEIEIDEIQFGCCFCGEAIPRDNMLAIIADLDPSTDDKWQQWWAHPHCFARVLDPGYRDFREEIQEAISHYP